MFFIHILTRTFDLAPEGEKFNTHVRKIYTLCRRWDVHPSVKKIMPFAASSSVIIDKFGVLSYFVGQKSLKAKRLYLADQGI